MVVDTQSQSMVKIQLYTIADSGGHLAMKVNWAGKACYYSPRFVQLKNKILLKPSQSN